MKKLFVLGLSLLASATFVHATITIDLAGGNLYTAIPGTVAPTGCLIQLIVSTTDNVFTAPNSGSFTGGSADDFVLASFSLNAPFGPGSFENVFNFALSAFPNLTPGDSLLLRWFPTLSGTTPPSAPPAGAIYGQFRIDIVEPPSDIGWFVPSDGAAVTLAFLTMAQGGTHPETDGLANMTVALIPEPSTLALLGVAMAGLVAYSRRRKV